MSEIPTNSPETFGASRHTMPVDAGTQAAAPQMQVIDCLQETPAADPNRSRPGVQRLLSAERANVITFRFLPGQSLPDHKAAHPITVQCLSGLLEFVCEDRTVTLTAGRVIHLPAMVVHAVYCPEDAPADNILLLTMLTGEE